jgi:hypothetical protein
VSASHLELCLTLKRRPGVKRFQVLLGPLRREPEAQKPQQQHASSNTPSFVPAVFSLGSQAQQQQEEEVQFHSPPSSPTGTTAGVMQVLPVMPAPASSSTGGADMTRAATVGSPFASPAANAQTTVEATAAAAAAADTPATATSAAAAAVTLAQESWQACSITYEFHTSQLQVLVGSADALLQLLKQQEQELAAADTAASYNNGAAAPRAGSHHQPPQRERSRTGTATAEKLGFDSPDLPNAPSGALTDSMAAAQAAGLRVLACQLRGLDADEPLVMRLLLDCSILELFFGTGDDAVVCKHWSSGCCHCSWAKPHASAVQTPHT